MHRLVLEARVEDVARRDDHAHVVGRVRGQLPELEEALVVGQRARVAGLRDRAVGVRDRRVVGAVVVDVEVDAWPDNAAPPSRVGDGAEQGWAGEDGRGVGGFDRLVGAVVDDAVDVVIGGQEAVELPWDLDVPGTVGGERQAVGYQGAVVPLGVVVHIKRQRGVLLEGGSDYGLERDVGRRAPRGSVGTGVSIDGGGNEKAPTNVGSVANCTELTSRRA